MADENEDNNSTSESQSEESNPIGLITRPQTPARILKKIKKTKSNKNK